MIKKFVLFCLLINSAAAFADSSFVTARVMNLGGGQYLEMPVLLKSDHTYEAYLRKIDGSFDQNGGQGYFLCESVIKGEYQETSAGYLLKGIGEASLKPCFGYQCLNVQFESELVPGLRGRSLQLEPLMDGSIEPITSTSLPACN